MTLTRSDVLPRAETGAAWLDLLATVRSAYGPAPFERLAGPAHLRTWLAIEHLAPRARITDDDVASARRLREALRGLGLAAVGAQPRRARDVAVLAEFVAADRPLDVRAGDPLTVRAPADAAEALARVARQAAEQLTAPQRSDLHRCGDADCGMLYLDPTGRRRWCATDVCGVRNRVRAHRQRQRTS